MSIDVEWYDEEKNIVLWILPPQWTWDDYRIAFQQSKALVMSVDHPVDIVANLTGSTLPPNALLNYRQVEQGSSSNRRYTVVVGGSSVAKSIINTFNRVFRRGNARLFMVDSVEEAVALLREREPIPSP